MMKAAVTGREGLAREVCLTDSQGHTHPTGWPPMPQGSMDFDWAGPPTRLRVPMRAEAPASSFSRISQSPSSEADSRAIAGGGEKTAAPGAPAN